MVQATSDESTADIEMGSVSLHSGVQMPSTKRIHSLEPSNESAQATAPQIPRLAQFCSISECLCVELCAGSAGLASALKELGFAILPIDWTKNRHTTFARCVSIDLTKDSARILFQQILDTGRVCYCHMAPPCGTGSKAREIPISKQLKARGAPEPKPLRSSQWPLGLPTISGTDKILGGCRKSRSVTFWEYSHGIF